MKVLWFVSPRSFSASFVPVKMDRKLTSLTKPAAGRQLTTPL